MVTSLRDINFTTFQMLINEIFQFSLNWSSLWFMANSLIAFGSSIKKLLKKWCNLCVSIYDAHIILYFDFAQICCVIMHVKGHKIELNNIICEKCRLHMLHIITITEFWNHKQLLKCEHYCRCFIESCCEA